MRHHGQQGAALIIVLTFAVLLSGLVLAFFTRAITERQVSESSANQTKVDLLARNAVNYIIGDLKEEIALSSNQPTDPNDPGSVLPIFYPKTPANMLPVRSGNPPFATAGDPLTDPIPNLVRRSWSDDSNLPVRSKASALGSATPSANGRSVSASRWNSHYLIPRLNTGDTEIDTTPVAAFVPPDWVMVTKDNGPEVITTPDPDVIGRYAYAIYDEGGLLDVNVAGGPSNLTPDQRGEKGSLGLADLTAVGLTSAESDKLVGWRNYATIQPGGTLSSSYSFDAAAAIRYLDFLRQASSGFLTVNQAAVSGRTDQTFAGRQALLRFRRAIGFSQDALQYLGTFSRDLEQPSFNPEPNLPMPADPIDPKARPKNIKYLIDTDNANDSCGDSSSNDKSGKKQDGINPFLLTIRNPSNGEPVMRRRFSLSRLALLRPNPPAADVSKIRDFFGLAWDNTNQRWIYDHGDPNRIYRLSEVATAGREPDFFETLKAVIHCDSLGKQQGAIEISPSPHSGSGALIDGKVHYQLLQIAANLIDQYDQDSYPTRIFFNNWEFRGIENLPYLAGWQQMWYRMRPLTPGVDISSTTGTPPTAAEGTTYETAVMLQPILWNPHAPDSNPNPPDVPTEFRITAGSTTDGAVQVWPQVAAAWWTGTSTAQVSSYPAPSGSFTYPRALIDPASSILTFNTGAGDAAFREPFRLRAPNYPPGTNASNSPGYPAGRLTVADPALVNADGGSSDVIGFYCGRAWTGPSVNHNNDQKWLSVGSVNRPFKLKLQYRQGSDWITYDVIEFVYNNSGNINTVDNTDTYPYLRAFRTCFRADPRTDRWGLFHMAVWPSTNSSDLPNGLVPLQKTGDNGVDGGYGNNAAFHYYLPQGITIKPDQNSSYVMSGAALGLALAVGWKATSAHLPSDIMTNLPRTPNANPNSGVAATGAIPTPANQCPPGAKYYFTDADGVIRRASGGNFSGNDGLPLYTGNYNSRPVILNRPFRSVAEMGYASRGQPWNEINFFTPESGDAALLDAFCINELEGAPENVAVAGRVSLNTRQPKVLEALLRGVSKAEGGVLTDGEALNAAQALVNWTSDTTDNTSGILNKGPLRHRGELVGKFVYQTRFTPALTGFSGDASLSAIDGSKAYQGFASTLTSAGIFSNAPDRAIKRRCESALRALADSGNARTWNLLIDLVAQTGRYSSRTTASTDLPKFRIEGETRLWVHLAIDRYTGTVIAKLVEPVTE